MKLLSSQVLRRAGVAVSILGIVGGGGLGFARRPVDALTQHVEAGPVERLAVGTGTIESEAQVSLAFTIPGRVSSVDVEEGDLVRAGDVVASIDATEHERSLAVAARGLDVASAAATRSDAELERAEVALGAAQRDEARVARLFASGSVAQAELDVARERLARARADLASAQASKRQGTGSIAAAKANVAVHSLRKNEGVLRSSVEGIVVRRLHEPGDVVGPAAPVLVLASTRKVLARVWLDESSLHDLHEGQEARVSLRSDPARPLRARLDRVAVEADRQTHEVLADLELVERPNRLVFGERADGVVVVQRRDAAMRVRRGVCDVARSRCLVDRDGVVAAVEARFGLVGNEWVEVESGLSAGDVLLTKPDDEGELPVGRRLRETRR